MLAIECPSGGIYFGKPLVIGACLAFFDMKLKGDGARFDFLAYFIGADVVLFVPLCVDRFCLV